MSRHRPCGGTLHALSTLFALSLALLTTGPILAQGHPLEPEINAIIQGADARVGVAVIFEGRDTLTINNTTRYPTMSVYKFHQALAVLDALNRNHLPLATQLFVRKSDLLPNTHSPLRDARPEGNFTLSVGELLHYSVALSDNNVCDLLFRYLGGVKPVDAYIAKLGIEDVLLSATERTMNKRFENQYLNLTTPLAAARLLELFRTAPLFAQEYRDFLVTTLLSTQTGPDKLKGLLPHDARVAHKTGSSSRDKTGMKAADNDIGIVYLPNGKTYSIALFVMDSRESDQTNAALIARISERVYRYFSAQ